MVVILKFRVGSERRLLRGWDHYWAVVRALGEHGRSFTSYQVAEQCEPSVGADVRDYIRRLVKAGIARRDDSSRLVLIERPRAAPSLRRDGSVQLQAQGRQQMWNVMRREVGGFTAPDLAIAGSTDEVRIGLPGATRYCRDLTAAGLLVIAAKQGGRPVYRLTGRANTGPRPPVVMRTRLVFDQNLEKIVGEPIAEEVTP